MHCWVRFVSELAGTPELGLLLAGILPCPCLQCQTPDPQNPLQGPIAVAWKARGRAEAVRSFCSTGSGEDI